MVNAKKQEKLKANAALNETSKGLMSGKSLMYITTVTVAFVALSAFQFLYMLWEQPLTAGDANSGPAAPTTVALPELDLTSEANVDKLLYGGFPHVVYCVKNSTQAAEAPAVIGDIKHRLLKRDPEAAVSAADCFSKTAFGQSIAEMYKFGTREGFVAVFANQEAPLQLNYFPNAKYVSGQILPKIKSAIKPIVYLKDWEDCTSMIQGACFVMGGANNDKLSNKLAEMEPYVKSHRGIKFVSVDTGFWRVKADKPLLETKPPASEEEDPVNGFCVYKKYPAGNVNVTENATIYGKFLQGWEDETVLKAFLDDCAAKKHFDAGDAQGWAVLSEYPAVKAKEGERKVIKRPKRGASSDDLDEDDEDDEEDDGTTQGAGERVGSRAELEEDEEEDDVEFEQAPEEDEEEMAL